NAIGGGGRYDNLVETLGGKPTPGVGFGVGLERLLIALESQGVEIPRPKKPLVWLIAHGDAARDANLKLIQELRSANIPADMDVSGRSVRSQFKMAEREGATHSITVGDSEIAEQTVKFKDMSVREESSVPRNQIIDRLQSLS